MNTRTPELGSNHHEDSRDSRESTGPRIKEFNNTLNPTLSGRVVLKAGLSMTAESMLDGLNLKSQLSRFSSVLEGKYTVNNLTATLNQDVTLDIRKMLILIFLI